MKLTKLQKLAESAGQNSYIKIFEPLHDRLEIAYENIEIIRNQLQSSVLTDLLKAEGFPVTEAKAAKDAAQIAFKAISDLEDEVRDLHQAIGTHFEDKDYDSKPYPMAEAKAIPQTAAQALAKGLTAAFGHEITLSAAMVKALEGLVAKGKVKDLGECVFDHDTMGKSKAPETSYFDIDMKDPQQKLQARELVNVTKLASGKTKEGMYVYLFKHKTLPVIYTVESDGHSGSWGVSRLELADS